MVRVSERMVSGRMVSGRMVAALAVLSIGATPVLAQTYSGPPVEPLPPGMESPPAPPPMLAPPGPGVVSSPELIAHCLCGEDRVKTLHQQAEDARHRFEDAQMHLDRLKQQIAQRSATVDSTDEGQVDEVRRMVEQSERENAHLFNVVQPSTQKSVERYNAEVADYNSQCAGRHFDSLVLQQVSATLSCTPLPQLAPEPLDPLPPQ